MHLALLLPWLNGEPITEVAQRPDIKITVTRAEPTPLAPRWPSAKPAPLFEALKPPLTPPASAPNASTRTAESSAESSVATQTSNPTESATKATPSILTSEADYQATELNNPKPLYPPRAIQQEAQGRVLLLVEVLPDGRAGRVTLDKSSGHAILDQSAMNTVRRWRFKPAQRDGAWITQTIRVPIDFTLKDSH